MDSRARPGVREGPGAVRPTGIAYTRATKSAPKGSMASTTTTADAAAPAERQPRALATLFFTEMWERFSYYGMRALLVLYLVHALGYQRSDALELYATYTGLVYITPILGGYLADRYLGPRKAILVGGVTMAMGHFAMAFPALLHL